MCYINYRSVIDHYIPCPGMEVGTDAYFEYAKMPTQYTEIFKGCKDDNFQLKCFDYFHIFA